MRAICIVVGICGALMSSCALEFDAELLAIQSISVDRIEPDSVVQIHGSDFPVGRDIALRFTGRVYRPEAEPREVSVAVRARSVADNVVEFTAGSDLIEAMGGRGTFKGDVRVSIAAASVEGTVSGVLRGVEIDFAPGAVARLSDEVGRLGRAMALMDHVGVELEDDGSFNGLPIARVRPGSPASRAGLGQGDRILEIDDVRIRALADFLPAPGNEVARLKVLREGESGPVTIGISVDDYFHRPIETETSGWFLVLAIVAMLLLFFAPTARAIQWLTRRLSPLASKPRVRKRPSKNRLAVFGARIAGFLIASLAFVAVPQFSKWWPSPMTLLAGIAFIRVASALIAIACSSEKNGFVPLRSHVLPVLTLVLTVVTVSMLAGSQQMLALQNAQGVAPWEWFAFAHPLTFVLLPAYLDAAFSVKLVPWNRDSSIAAVFDQVYVLLCTVLGVFLFLGGTLAPENNVFASAISTAAFLTKAWVLLWIGNRIRRAEIRSLRWSFVVALAATAAAIGLLLVDLPASLLNTSGPILSSATLMVLLYWIGRRIFRALPIELQRVV